MDINFSSFISGYLLGSATTGVIFTYLFKREYNEIQYKMGYSNGQHKAEKENDQKYYDICINGDVHKKKCGYGAGFTSGYIDKYKEINKL
jgi:hypothetical protein